MNTPIKVALVDDQALFRAGIGMVINAQSDMTLVGEGADGTDVIRLVRECEPDVVLMDVRMPTMDGVSATRKLVNELGANTPKILIFTTFDLDDNAASAIEAGASGFLLKDTRPEMLLESIRAVADGSQVIAASATKKLFEATRPRRTLPTDEGYESLTPREREILLAAARGLSNAEIARAEFLSEATVKTHMSRILNKLHLRDRVQLVVYAYEHGLL